MGEAGQTVRHAYDHLDLPAIRPVVTRVRIFGRRCPGCRRRLRGAAPARLPPGSPFGPAIVARLRRAEVIGCDETGARLMTTAALGTRMGWEWVLVSDRAVLPRIRPSRGRDVVTEVLGDHRPRCWVSDRWGAQQGHAATQQLCLAHVLRDVQYAVEAGEPRFAPALRRLLCWAIAGGRRRPALKDSTLAQYRAKADRRLDRLLALPAVTPAGAGLRRQPSAGARSSSPS